MKSAKAKALGIFDLGIEPIFTLDKRLLEEIRNPQDPYFTEELKTLVLWYYSSQRLRIRFSNRIKSISKKDKIPLKSSEILLWMTGQSKQLETQIQTMLKRYIDLHPLGYVFRQTPGCTSVGAASILSLIDWNKVHSAGSIWKWALLDPENKLRKSRVNEQLKRALWMEGARMIAYGGATSPYYNIYLERKWYEWEKNLRGEYESQAFLNMNRVGEKSQSYLWYTGRCNPKLAKICLYETGKPTTADCYDGGFHIPMLSPSHIHNRAARYMIKVFVAHLYHRWHEYRYDKPPKKPYVLTNLMHAEYWEPPQKLVLLNET